MTDLRNKEGLVALCITYPALPPWNAVD